MSENKNLEIYEKVRVVPSNAQKTIKGGRLSGMTDINPMWRIKTLTEQFGPCGIGWKYEIIDKSLESGADKEVAAFVEINLYIKINNEWSEAIPGTGGSKFVTSEKNGPYVSDECFKMALTDALSVACKALGIGADIYWQDDRSKYDNANNSDKPKTKIIKGTTEMITEEQKAKFKDLGITEKNACIYCKVDSIDKITKIKAQAMIDAKEKRQNVENNQETKKEVKEDESKV